MRKKMEKKNYKLLPNNPKAYNTITKQNNNKKHIYEFKKKK